MKTKTIALLLVCIFLLASFSAISVTGEERTKATDTNTEENQELKPSPFHTCFKEGTQITMADGTTKNIENLTRGDEIKSYDFKKEKFTSWKVKSVEYPNRPVYDINYGELYITEDHPLMIKKPDNTTGWGQIEIMPKHVRLRGQEILKIEEGDKIFTENETWIEIENISYDNTTVKCVNIFSYSGTKNYFANGFLAYEEHPYPRFMLRYYLYRLFEKIPFLNQFKDIFLF